MALWVFAAILPLLGVSLLAIGYRCLTRCRLPASAIPWRSVLRRPTGGRRPRVQGKRIAVIGGGVGGCAAAHALGMAGAEMVVFEAGPQLGGRLKTVETKVGRWPVRADVGMDSAADCCPALDSLVQLAGLHERVSTADARTKLVNAAKSTPLRLLSSLYFLWNSEAFPFKLRLRLAKLKLMSVLPRRRLDVHDPLSMAGAGGRGVRAKRAVAKVVGGQLQRELVEPLCRASFGVSPRRVPLEYMLSLFGDSSWGTRWFLDDGMASLCRGLVHPPGGDVAKAVRLNTIVTTLDTRPDGTVLVTAAKGASPPTGEVFDGVVVCLPAPAAHALVRPLPEAVVSHQLKTFAETAVYHPALVVVFLCRVTEFKRHPTHPSLFPVRDEGASEAPAVASVTFPSGRLETPTPPGYDVIEVRLTAAGAKALLPCLADPEAAMPPRPDVTRGVSRVPEELTKMMDARAPAPPTGSKVGLTAREVAVAEHVWDLARLEVPGKDLPGVFCDVLAVQAWPQAWLDTQPSSGRWATAAELVRQQLASKTTVALGGDFLGGGTAEGAVRSALWAVQALTQ